MVYSSSISILGLGEVFGGDVAVCFALTGSVNSHVVHVLSSLGLPSSRDRSKFVMHCIVSKTYLESRSRAIYSLNLDDQNGLKRPCLLLPHSWKPPARKHKGFSTSPPLSLSGSIRRASLTKAACFVCPAFNRLIGQK